MKILSYSLATIAFIAASVFLCRNGNWFTGSLSLLCAAACRVRTEALP